MELALVTMAVAAASMSNEELEERYYELEHRQSDELSAIDAELCYRWASRNDCLASKGKDGGLL